MRVTRVTLQRLTAGLGLLALALAMLGLVIDSVLLANYATAAFVVAVAVWALLAAAGRLQVLDADRRQRRQGGDGIGRARRFMLLLVVVILLYAAYQAFGIIGHVLE